MAEKRETNGALSVTELLGEGGEPSRVEGVRFAVDEDTRVAEIRLEDGAGNRFSLARLRRLSAIVEALAGMGPEGPVRSLLWTAAGEDFCHGADMTDPELVAAMTAGDEGRAGVAELGQRFIEALDGLPLATVVAAQGRILGAGACVFLAADFRLSDDEASLRFPEVDRGMYLSWGILPIAARELGAPMARRLALTGKAERVSALPSGAMYHCGAGWEEQARDLAVDLAKKPPLALRANKQVLQEASAGAQSAAARDAERFAATTGSEDFGEAMAAWLNKRPPEFKGR